MLFSKYRCAAKFSPSSTLHCYKKRLPVTGIYTVHVGNVKKRETVFCLTFPPLCINTPTHTKAHKHTAV